MVKKWFTDFSSGSTSTNNADCSGRPIEVSTPENVENIHYVMLADQKVKLREIFNVKGFHMAVSFPF